MFGSNQGTPSTGGLFGTSASASIAPASTTQTGGIFGAQNPGSLFGGAAPAKTGGLFGSPAPTAAPATTGIFGNTAAPAAAPQSGLFGSTAPTPTTAAAPQTGLFGSTATTTAPVQTGLFGSTTPASTTQAGGLFTGQKPAAPSGGLFNSPAQPATTALAPTGLFGTAPTTAPATSSAPVTAALFGAPASTITPKLAPLVPATSATASSASSLFTSTSTAAPATTTATSSAPTTALFGSTPSLTTATTTASTGLFGGTTTAAPTAQTSLFGATATPKVKGSAVTSSLMQPSIPMISTTKPISFGELEKVANNLVMDVLSQEKLFLNQTLEINAYDREIRDNQAKLIAADKEVAALEESRDRLAYNLNFIDMQQKELETVITDLEKKLGLPDWTDCGQNFPVDLTYAMSADQQRTNIMKLLTSVDAQIKEADDDINEINEQLIAMNKVKDPEASDDVTVEQIQKVLKKQLENIIWIDKKSEEISEKASKLAATYASIPDA